MSVFSALSSAFGHVSAMKPITRRNIIPGLLSCVFLISATAAGFADADPKKKVRREWRDHDKALTAREGGTVLPLASVLAVVRAKIDGEIIEMEFEYEDDIPVYEFKYVNGRGQVREIYADARTGAILEDKQD